MFPSQHYNFGVLLIRQEVYVEVYVRYLLHKHIPVRNPSIHRGSESVKVYGRCFCEYDIFAF